MEKGKFIKYDYGNSDHNEAFYGKGNIVPPSYDFAEVKKLPLALVCGREDLLSSPRDYMRLVTQLT